jgi:hypothetical protein
MNTFGKLTFAALLGAGALAMTATGASARIFCNARWRLRLLEEVLTPCSAPT